MNEKSAWERRGREIIGDDWKGLRGEENLMSSEPNKWNHVELESGNKWVFPHILKAITVIEGDKTIISMGIKSTWGKSV